MKDTQRILLKVTGQAFGNKNGDSSIFDRDALEYIAGEIADSVQQNPHTALVVVVGGGNIARGGTLVKTIGLPESAAHDIGMISTDINGVALKALLRARGIETHHMTSIGSRKTAEEFSRDKADRCLEAGTVLILSGGTGEPGITTDFASVQKAIGLGVKHVLKGTKVDGIYSADPKKHDGAELLPRVSYLDYLHKDLKIMDGAAVNLARDAKVTIRVFDLFEHGNLARLLGNEDVGSLIGDEA